MFDAPSIRRRYARLLAANLLALWCVMAAYPCFADTPSPAKTCCHDAPCAAEACASLAQLHCAIPSDSVTNTLPLALPAPLTYVVDVVTPAPQWVGGCPRQVHFHLPSGPPLNIQHCLFLI